MGTRCSAPSVRITPATSFDEVTPMLFVMMLHIHQLTAWRRDLLTAETGAGRGDGRHSEYGVSHERGEMYRRRAAEASRGMLIVCACMMQTFNLNVVAGTR